MVALNFNASAVQPNQSLEPVPSGQYPVVISASSEKPTKAADGSYLELEMTIQQPNQFAGRKVYDRLNLKNKNQQAVDIAYGTLSAICHVTGRIQVQDSSQLHGVLFIAVVTKGPRNDAPDQMSNTVRGYKDMNGNDPGVGGQVSQPGAQPAWAGQAPAPQQNYAAPPQGYAPPVQQAYAPQPQQGQPQGYVAPQQPAPQQQPPAWGQPPQQQVQQQPVAPQGQAPTGQTPPAWTGGAPTGQPAAGANPPWGQPTA